MEKFVKEAIEKVLLEESNKVKRDEFNRVLYKLQEIEESTKEIEKELKKMETMIPYVLRQTMGSKLLEMKNNLSTFYKSLFVFKEKLKTIRKKTNTTPIKVENKV